MPEFSIIAQNATVRALVQENLLERAFHDALFPRLIFRSEVAAREWPAGVGDSMIFTAPGLLPVSMRPLQPGTDPIPQTYGAEQWEAQLQQYAGTIDTNMPTSMVAIADLFLRNAQQLGLQAAQSLNRKVRNRAYNAAESGWTVADGAQSGTTLRVKRLNGFTRARSTSGNAVRFTAVSSSNPLPIKVFDNGAEASFNVIGYTPDTAGDEIGPGTLTLSAGTTSVANRAYVISDDRTAMVRVGGGNKIDDIISTDLPTLSSVRSMVARLWQMNVNEHEDGRFHAHCSPTSVAKMYEDSDLQRLNTSLPDYYMYKQFALGEILNTIFVRNTECPTVETVLGGSTATYSQDDDFAGELTANGAVGGQRVERILFTGRDYIFEMYSNLAALVTEAGLNGKVADAKITNQGIEVFSDRIQMILRSPLNRLQDMVSASWRFIGDWPVRTDATTGDAARYKRVGIIQHAG
jgi:hypothetical protein